MLLGILIVVLVDSILLAYLVYSLLGEGESEPMDAIGFRFTPQPEPDIEEEEEHGR